MGDEIQYQLGIPVPLRDAAARLYDDAFLAKLSVAVRSREKRLALLADSLSLPFAVTATAEDRLIGLAGFQTPQGSLTGGSTVRKLIQHLGPAGGLWAAMVFSLYRLLGSKIRAPSGCAPWALNPTPQTATVTDEVR